MKVTPLNDKILIRFLDEIKNGYFKQKHASGIIIDRGGNHKFSADNCRLAEIIAVGPKARQFSIGDVVGIQALKWTNKIPIGPKQFAWMTEVAHVIGVYE
jgi:co-chaperonin GroES (HSP10)